MAQDYEIIEKDGLKMILFNKENKHYDQAEINEEIDGRSMNLLQEVCNISPGSLNTITAHTNEKEIAVDEGGVATKKAFAKLFKNEHNYIIPTEGHLKSLLISFKHLDTYPEKLAEYVLREITLEGVNILEEDLILAEKGDDLDENGDRKGTWSHNSVLICFNEARKLNYITLEGYSNYTRGKAVRILPIKAYTTGVPIQLIKD